VKHSAVQKSGKNCLYQEGWQLEEESCCKVYSKCKEND